MGRVNAINHFFFKWIEVDYMGNLFKNEVKQLWKKNKRQNKKTGLFWQRTISIFFANAQNEIHVIFWTYKNHHKIS